MAGKWYLPFKRGKVNYENVGRLPYLLQHDVGFSGTKIYRPVEVSGNGFTLRGNYGMTRKEALAWIKEHGAVKNPKKVSLPTKWTAGKFRVNSKGEVQLMMNPRSLRVGGGGRFARCVKSVEAKGGAIDARAVCAAQGIAKYGKRKFQKMARAGKKRAARRRKR